MNIKPPPPRALTENSTCHEWMTRKNVRERAVEIAVTDGRDARDATKADWEQAKRELTGNAERERPSRPHGSATELSAAKEVVARTKPENLPHHQ